MSSNQPTYCRDNALSERDTTATQDRHILQLTLANLPPDMEDRECTAVIIAATGGSRAEIGTLLGYDCVDSVTRWRRERADVIKQAQDNLQTLLKGIARLTMTNILMTGLELARKTLRHASKVEDEDAGDALVKVARAGRDITALADWITDHAESPGRSSSPPAWGTPPKSMSSSLLALKEIVDVADDDTPPA